MDKKLCWTVIFLMLAINVVMLQWTVESYLGREYEKVLTYSGVAIAAAAIAFLSIVYWKKADTKEGKQE